MNMSFCNDTKFVPVTADGLTPLDDPSSFVGAIRFSWLGCDLVRVFPPLTGSLPSKNETRLSIRSKSSGWGKVLASRLSGLLIASIKGDESVAFHRDAVTFGTFTSSSGGCEA